MYAQDRAWHTGDAAALATADAPATFLRFELLRGGEALPATAGKVETRCLLEHAIDLDPARASLMRCDRVDFAPGGVARAGASRGQSSIVYVDAADAARGRPRQYTVYVDEPLVLP